MFAYFLLNYNIKSIYLVHYVLLNYRVKNRLHELFQQDKEFTPEDRVQINPTNALSINAALDFVKNPVRCCQHVHALIQKLMDIVRIKKDDPKTKGIAICNYKLRNGLLNTMKYYLRH